MFTKLQPDQISLFWEIIRHGMIMVYRIPENLKQDFAIGTLTSLLSGMSQAWVGYELDNGNRELYCVLTTRIVEDKNHGIRYLYIDSLYSYRLVSEDMPTEAFKALEDFARANDCKMIMAEYSLKRVENILLSNGYEKHTTVCRKYLD